MLTKRIAPAVSGFNLFLRFEIILDATEKTLSDGADVAGIDKYFLANFASVDSFDCFSNQKSALRMPL